MKHKSRIKTTAEIFTPKELVNEILDKIPQEQYCDHKTFCDPACGVGIFLTQVKDRLLDQGASPSHVLYNQLYGAELMTDNAMDCIYNLLTSDTDPITITRYNRVKNELPVAIAVEDNDKLALSVYETKNAKIYVVRTTQQSINIPKNAKGINRARVLAEIKQGVTWFNYRINDGDWVTYPNVVACNGLEYDYTFGRTQDFSLHEQ